MFYIVKDITMVLTKVLKTILQSKVDSYDNNHKRDFKKCGRI